MVPSIASANPLILKEELETIAFLPELHIDIEDGNFIPNITFGMKTVRAITGLWKGTANVHLFVARPADYIEEAAACGVSTVFFHAEADGYPLELAAKIRKHGMKAGIAFNPKTSFAEWGYALDKADFCLLMSSEPDGEGQVFLPHTLERVRNMRRMTGPEKEIWVDGGIGESEARSLLEAGANVLVMGRYFFERRDKKELIKRLLPAAESGAP
ncbi:MAG: ribulose-phosphate 3-epimerase [Treponema sp.]|jgi:ribulose-phosphate 3-epimerase|nr:ribulose-phosphate 3-epimerase [Treponema sp.]